MASGGTFLYLSPKLPTVSGLKQVKLQTPMKVYTKDNLFIAQFGEKYRIPIKFENVPNLFVKAILAAEDDRFFSHPGIDIIGLGRAALELTESGHIQSGGSTITMQVARNYLLTSKKTFLRKFNEILLSLRIEQILSKEEILELYFNVIYMGNRAYGIEAAAKRYYGKSLNELKLDEVATLAGLPKAPSVNNPITNPAAALERRNWILNRMLSLNYISAALHDQAIKQPINASLHDEPAQVDASYIAEMVRDDIFKKYNDSLHNGGWSVYTTIDSHLQQIGHQAVVDGLIEYEQRHGYRGPTKKYSLSNHESVKSISRLVNNHQTYGDLLPALVTNVNKSDVIAIIGTEEKIKIGWDELKWASPYINVNRKGNSPQKSSDILKIGDLIYVKKTEDDRWLLTQLPEAEAALITLNPNDGAIKALVGGFSFNRSKFNRVTQANRQPGSNFKPFIYSAALDNGFTPASIIDDAPIELSNGYGKVWKPQNSDGKFLGPIRLREALYKSRNLVSVRLLQAISVPTAIDYVARFGFNKEGLPKEYSLALGTASVTPLSIATGYATFANGGYKISPYFIDKIINNEGEIIFQPSPNTVCSTCDASSLLPIAPRIIDARNVYMMNSILSDVVRLGTATKAKSLGRSDLAGKTGTTNEQKDNWFSGFNADLVTTVWVGFDNPSSLGNKEYGATTALPIWMSFMDQALKNQPEKMMPQPEGITAAKIDPVSGLLTSAEQSNAIFELFRNEDLKITKTDSQSSTPDQPVSNGILPTQLELSPSDLF